MLEPLSAGLERVSARVATPDLEGLDMDPVDDEVEVSVTTDY
ncbi:hypothetical protein ABZO31_14100 [Streptomyces sp. HUAS MG47]